MKHEKPRDDDATQRRIMTANEVAAYFKVHPTTIYKLLRRGKLPAFKIGTDWRWDAIEKLVIDRQVKVPS